MISFKTISLLALYFLILNYLVQKLSNENIDTKQRNAILKMENDIIGENLQRLYESLSTLGDSKITEDKYHILVETLKTEKSELNREIDSLKAELSRCLIES